MAKLSADQIKGYASAAGFKGDDLNVAVAVAFAESGGDPRSHNPTPPDDSYGLWQINMLGSMGPDRRKRFKLKSNEDLYDPATNARVAYGIFQGSGWKAWTTYTRGTYKKFMGDAADAAGESDESTPAPAASSDGGIITGGLNALGANIFQSVANMGGVAVALVLIIGAIIILMMQSKTGKSIVKKGVKRIS